MEAEALHCRCLPLLRTLNQIAEVGKSVQVNKDQVLLLLIACNHLRLNIELWSSRRGEVRLREEPLIWLLDDVLLKIFRLIRSYCCSDWIEKPWIYLARENGPEFEALLDSLNMHVDLIYSALVQDSGTKYFRRTAWENAKVLKQGLQDSAAADRRKIFEFVSRQSSARSWSVREKFTSSSVDGLMDWIDPSELRLDQQIPLGHGSFGNVFQTSWAGHSVAVKMFSSEFWSGSPWEGEVMVKLRPCHPSVLQVLGWSEAEEKSLLVMELMQHSLAKLIGKLRKSSLLVTIEVLLQVAEGMSFVHGKGVIHRDLKPANVLVNYEGSLEDGTARSIVAKVADFGLAKLNFSSNDFHTHLRGTLMYMAPELLVGDGDTRSQYERSVDVYSFGILCAEVLTGIRPFAAGLDRKSLLEQLQGGLRPKLPENCPQALKEAIQLCWETQPHRRPIFETVSAMLWGLKGFLLTGCFYSIPGSGITVQGKLMIGERLTGQGKFATETHWSTCYWIRHHRNGSQTRITPVTELNSADQFPEYVLTACDLDARIELVCITVDRIENTATSCSAFAGYGGVVECSDYYKNRNCKAYRVKVSGGKLKAGEGKASLIIRSKGLEISRGCWNKIRERFREGLLIDIPMEASSSSLECLVEGGSGSSYRLKFESTELRDLAVLTMKGSVEEWGSRRKIKT